MKRILSILSAFLVLTVTMSLLLPLSSCSKKSDDSNKPTDGSNTSADVSTNTVTSVQATTQTTTTAPAPDTPVVFTYDFTGKTTKLPTPTPKKLPAWKGFNLLNLFQVDSMTPFDENEFKMISAWGFDFVRIPMDYRCWATSGDWNVMDEQVMEMIDKAVEYGIKYDVHVCLNFHRAPGYTVATPPEETDLWTQPEPQEAFADMWAKFAARYKNVPNEYLSFDLVNEPGDMDESIYAAVMKKAADAIWAQDPKRLIIADGLSWGMTPSNMIKDLGIAQATRGYQPMTLTHYLAEWIDGADSYPIPTWPTVAIPQYLYSFGKSDLRSIYSITHDFNEAYNLDINVGTVSNQARLIVKADGVEIYNHLFESGPGTGDWTTSVYVDEWKIYQNIFSKDYRVNIPAGTKLLTLEVTDGDWMTVNDMKFASVSGTGKAFSLTPNTPDWGVKIPSITIDADGNIVLEGADIHNGNWLKNTYLTPWINLINSGGGAMVGEWGSYDKTPHDVVLRWMEDNLNNFKEAGLGWALWNFNGSFGILNSGRDDVDYEDFNGYQLDRQMLDLLQKYLDY